MDLVEIVVRTEDAFGIQISDVEATQITTTRELADFVATKVPLSDEPSCLSQHSFYFLRERFGRHLSFSRRSFYPNALLEDFVPEENRKFIWATLRAEVGANALPDLARPVWLFWTLAAATVFVFFYATIFLWSILGLFWAFWFGLTATIAFGYLSAVITRPMKQNFRYYLQSLSQVARYLVANKPHVFKRDERTWTRAQILAVVREIITDESGIKDFDNDAHFIKDLHLG